MYTSKGFLWFERERRDAMSECPDMAFHATRAEKYQESEGGAVVAIIIMVMLLGILTGLLFIL